MVTNLENIKKYNTNDNDEAEKNDKAGKNNEASAEDK